VTPVASSSYRPLTTTHNIEEMQATISSLREQNKQLSEEVKQLVIAENKLYTFQSKLDYQVGLYRKLYELGKSFNQTFELSQILTLTTQFVIYELGYERCLILLFNPTTNCFEIQSFDGYYEEADIAPIASLTLPLASFSSSAPNAPNDYDICLGNCQDTQLTALRSVLGIDDYVAFDLRQEAHKPIGVLIAGNTTAMARYQTPVSEEADSLLGLANAAGQATAAINNVRFYQTLEEARSHLEKRVQARTQDLNDKNASLERTLTALQQTQAQLVQSEKMSGLGQLVAGVAHEINNPVNFIYGNLKHANNHSQDLLDLLEEFQTHYPEPHPAPLADLLADIDLDFLGEDLPKVMASMKMGATRIKEIVLSLRTFSRMDEAGMKSVDIHEGINSTLRLLEHKLTAKSGEAGLSIVKEYGQVPSVECYAGQLNQVFMNLLSNAIDAIVSDDNKPPSSGQITIQTRVESDHVLIAIADNGPGIPAAIRDKIFNPFFTTKPVGQGTGLGLSISYQIVCDRHQGSLICESSEGEGTRFLISIPMKIKR